MSIVVLDALTYAGNPANLAGLDGAAGYHFVHGDICDGDLLARLFREHAFDTVVHFAAESHVDRSIVSSEPFVRTNVLGTQSAARRGARRLEAGFRRPAFPSHLDR